MHTPTAHETRAADVRALGERSFDLLVIGGGITGCGIARDAALRGLDVALVEKDDFASGTSSRSSRLIHGGVRYLEHGHLRLVFESSAERRRMLKLAPHLVRPLAFTWPVYEGSRIPRWKLGAGLLLYDALSMFRNVGRHRRLSAEGVVAREPKLRRDGLRGGAMYYDASTDDARLTLANALDARASGAVTVNHVEARSLRVEHGIVRGAIVVDRLADRQAEIEVRASIVVNATGPWSDRLRLLDHATRPAVRGSKGAHIEVQRSRVGNDGAITLLSPSDGRVLFVLPSGDHTIIGTTDTFTSEAPDDVRASADDVEYLLRAANSFFPDAGLATRDVVSAWAGIRPLVPTDDATPRAASREHAVTVSEHGLISITGGKLTTYRVMAAEVVDLAVRRLGRPSIATRTKHRPLFGGEMAGFDTEVATATSVVRDGVRARHLVASHGSAWRDVWTVVRETPDGGEPLVSGSTICRAEVRYAVTREMACSPGDFLIRRTRLAVHSADHGRGAARVVAAEMGALLGWNAARVEAQIAAYDREVSRILGELPGLTR